MSLTSYRAAPPRVTNMLRWFPKREHQERANHPVAADPKEKPPRARGGSTGRLIAQILWVGSPVFEFFADGRRLTELQIYGVAPAGPRWLQINCRAVPADRDRLLSARLRSGLADFVPSGDAAHVCKAVVRVRGASNIAGNVWPGFPQMLVPTFCEAWRDHGANAVVRTRKRAARGPPVTVRSMVRFLRLHLEQVGLVGF